MKKQKQLDRLGHSMLKAQAMLSAGMKETYDLIKEDKKLSRKEENALLRGIIETLQDSIKDIASIMASAEESDTFVYKQDNDQSIAEIATELGVKLELCEKCREEASKKILNEDYKNDALADIIKKASGKNVEVKTYAGKGKESLIAALDEILKDVKQKEGK